MADGWTRFESNTVFNGRITRELWSDDDNSWLSQANHIFRRLKITSNFDNYVLVQCVNFTLEISPTTEELPTGFLFLPPAKDFQTGPFSFRWPDCPAYWSVDPSGVDPLRMEAAHHRFLSVDLTTTIEGWSWDATVYAGLRQFHQAKGFDPDSLDLARDLGSPLYQISEKHCDDDTEKGSVPMNKLETSPHATIECSGIDAGEEPETPRSHAEMLAVSWTFKFFMNVQLALILFFALSWLYKVCSC
ncbi:hypothetical protein C8J57DRAFT_348073 [Mycena rebaudengoi]|nr:hypothetical protein C8J57DRAFT_348073 [Mycena rebaudengoi]